MLSKKALVRWLVAAVLATTPLVATATEGRPSANDRLLSQPPPGQGYHLWIVGHSYGRSIYQVPSLLANIGMINSSGAVGLVMLGDTVRVPTPMHLEVLDRVLKSIEMPVFIAPGNHELREPELWRDRFGPSYYEFRIGHDQYVVFEISLGNERLPDDQLDWFRRAMERAAGEETVRNVIVLTHHMAWAIDDPRLETLRNNLTYPKDYRAGYFEAHIDPILERVAERKPVYWVSGDRTHFPPFYWEVPERNITYLITGIQGDEKDSILQLRSSPAGDLRFRFVSLAGQEMMPVEEYGPEYWDAYYAGKPRSYFLAKPKDVRWVQLRAFVTNRRFTVGLLAGLVSGATTVLVAGMFWLRRSRRTRVPH